jgi:4-hydroxybenzoate polyprenyltransferase
LADTVLPLPADSDATPPFRRALSAIRIIHPFPTLLNVAATVALALIADNGVDPPLLARMAATMFAIQSAIGVTNDIFDRELDAAAKPHKPIVSGAVPLRAATLLALLFVAVAIALAATLGVASFALAMLGMACGLAYDVRLKRTVFSAVPFMIAIPTLPYWVWVTVGAWEDDLWWLAPLGALIGLSLHLANTLPDIDDDAAHGIRGLAHALGRRASMIVAWTSFAAALALAVVIAPVVDYDAGIIIAALAFASTCLLISIVAWATRGGEMAFRIGFAALAIGSVVAATGWLAAVT